MEVLENQSQTTHSKGCGEVKFTYSLEETATLLGFHVETVRRLIKDGKLRKLPVRHIRISAVELNRFLTEGTHR